MTINYTIGKAGSMAGVPHFHITDIDDDSNWTEAVQQIIKTRTMQPTVVMLEMLTIGSAEHTFAHEFLSLLRDQFKCRVVLKTWQEPDTIANEFDWVIRAADLYDYHGTIANECWLYVAGPQPRENLNLPRAHTQAVPISVVTPPKYKTEALVWAMTQSAAVRIFTE